MTPAQAYECDGTFRMLVDTWSAERRCPLPLVDRCLELEMPAAAAAARWAATESDLYPAEPINVRGGEKLGPCGPYPAMNFGNGKKPWCWREASAPPRLSAFDVPKANAPDLGADSFDSPLSAILWLLANWKETP